MSLSIGEMRFLKMIMDRSGTGDPVAAKLPISPNIQNLIDRGYLRTVKLFDGPFMVPVDEPGLRITEAGLQVYHAANTDGVFAKTPCPVKDG